jgi:hypothetical protein
MMQRDRVPASSRRERVECKIKFMVAKADHGGDMLEKGRGLRLRDTREQNRGEIGNKDNDCELILMLRGFYHRPEIV